MIKITLTDRATSQEFETEDDAKAFLRGFLKPMQLLAIVEGVSERPLRQLAVVEWAGGFLPPSKRPVA